MKNYRDTIARSKNKGTKKLIEVVIIEKLLYVYNKNTQLVGLSNG